MAKDEQEMKQDAAVQPAPPAPASVDRNRLLRDLRQLETHRAVLKTKKADELQPDEFALVKGKIAEIKRELEIE